MPGVASGISDHGKRYRLSLLTQAVRKQCQALIAKDRAGANRLPGPQGHRNCPATEHGAGTLTIGKGAYVSQVQAGLPQACLGIREQKLPCITRTLPPAGRGAWAQQTYLDARGGCVEDKDTAVTGKELGERRHRIGSLGSYSEKSKRD